MINVGDTLADDRWEVVAPFLAGNGRNFSYFVVEDRAVGNRAALLKAVRKTDLPSEPLYQWRCEALRAEIGVASKLTCPFVPEPLDAEDGEKADPYVVYSLIGQAEKNYLLREKLQLYGFITRPRGPGKDNKDEGWRSIETLARYLHDLLKATDELWDAGFVHTNLNPDHLFMLRDDVLRVTGMSAVVPFANGKVSPTAPGLRNLSMGYQSAAQFKVAQTAAKTPAALADAEPLSAEVLRWHTYAALTLDLVWGRDLREYCARNGFSYIHSNDALQNEVRRDFPSFFRTEPKTKKQEERWYDMQPYRDQLWEAIVEILNMRGKLPANLGPRFHKIWGELAKSEYVSLFPIHSDETKWREERNWTRGKFHPGRFAPAEDRAVDEYIVVSAEEWQERKDAKNEKNTKISARYRVVNASHPARSRLDMQKIFLKTVPSRHHYFLPGDIIPGVSQVGERNLPNGRTNPRIDIYTADWMDPEQAPRKPVVGQRMRALSIGRRFTTLERSLTPLPWATIEMDGNLQTYPIRPATVDQNYTVFPAPGRFFNAEFKENPRWGFGVVPIEAPSLSHLLNREQVVVVRDVSDKGLWFDLRVNDDYLVTCMLPTADWRGEVERGGEIPIRVDSVTANTIRTVWDMKRAAKASPGQEFDARVDGVNQDRTRVWVRFGREQYNGLLNTELAGVIPWGVPVGDWERGTPLRVRVRAVLDGGRSYGLELAAQKLPKVDEVLRVGEQYAARVSGHGGKVVFVEMSDAERVVRVVARIRSQHLTMAQKRDLAESFPIGQELKVKIEDIDPRMELVEVVPVGEGR
jgi:hypothetical protein